MIASADARRLEFKYDYQGRRVRKITYGGWNGTVYSGTALTDTKFLYDGWNLIAEFTVGSGGALSLAKTYTWGLDLTGSLTASGGVGALLQIYDANTGGSSKTLLPTYDGNGNVAALLNAETGATLTLEAAYEYDPFGNTLRSEGAYAATNPFRFSTKFTDTETGLVYYGLRYYSPTLGRFINKDPLEEQGGLNLYGFCGNNGVNRWDLLGQRELRRYEWGVSGDVVAAPELILIDMGGGFVMAVEQDYDDGQFFPEGSGRSGFLHFRDAITITGDDLQSHYGTDGTLGDFLADWDAGRLPWTRKTTTRIAPSTDYIPADNVGTRQPTATTAPNSTPGSNPAWDAQFAKDTQPNRLLASNGGGDAALQGALDFQKGLLGVGPGDANSVSGQLGRGTGYATLVVPAVEAYNAAAPKAAPLLGKAGDALFGRGTGLLNSNDYIRIGWGWKGSATTGQEVFRIAIGNKDSFIHWHFP